MATPNSAANQSAIFSLTPVIAQNILFASGSPIKDDIGATGLANIRTIASGNNFGTRIELINITASGTTTAGVIRLFVDNSQAGGFYTPNTGVKLWREVLVTAVVPSATAVAYTTELVRIDGRALIILPSGQILKASTEKAETFSVICHGGDY